MTNLHKFFPCSAAALLPALALLHVATAGAMDMNPQEPTDFETPLLRPSNTGGALGIFRPAAPFTLATRSQAVPLLDGAATDLLVYETVDPRGSLIDPVLVVRKRQQVTATLENDLDNGENTNIHWHGLSLDGHNDGGPFAVAAPGENYEYAYKVRNRGGTYWYHPHAMGSTAEQAYRGLASFYIVKDRMNDRLSEQLGLQLGKTDIPVVIQDKRFDMDNQLVYEPSDDDMMMGVLGNVVLANLTAKPLLNVKTRIYRFRLLNGSNARIYKLAFVKEDVHLPFSIIGTDGGLLAQPQGATEVFLAPGERVDVLLDLTAAAAGDDIFLKSLEFDPMDNEMGGEHGMGAMSMDMEESMPNGAELYIMRLRVRTARPYNRTIPAQLSKVSPIDTTGAFVREFTLAQGEDGMSMEMRWLINGANFNDAPAFVPFQVDRGAVEIWEITNEMASMPHPMHLHGFQFQVLERMWMHAPEMSPWEGLTDEMGLVATDKGWKDTVLLWPGETVRIAIDFSQPFSGIQDYVFHCHNLEHEEGGMMLNYQVK